MYAVIKTGGKQYKVQKDQVIKVEKLGEDPKQDVEFNEVMMYSDGENVTFGAPLVENAKVIATVQEQGKDKKVKILKFKRRKHYMKRQGHRQTYTEVKIKSIEINS